MQQNTHAKFLLTIVRQPRKVELYSAFYISIFCQELPRPLSGNNQPFASHFSSPLSSPGGFDELTEENRRLRIQLKRYKDLLQDKSDQLLEKNESLISLQTHNAKHLWELAQATKEKMEQHVALEENKRSLDSYREQLGVKEEKMALQGQLNSYNKMQE